MARPRLLVVSSERLDRLDALLVAAGAARGQVVGLDDALELFAAEPADEALVLVDLDATPITDAGLLRRWCNQRPDARILWIGDDPATIQAFAAAGVRGAALRWPLDLEDLALLAHGDLGPTPAGAAPHDSTAPEPESRPEERPEGGADSAGPATELSRIEEILGQETTPPAAPPRSDPAAQATPTHTRTEPTAGPRPAFLAARERPTRSRPAPAAAASPRTEMAPAPAPSASSGGHPLDALDMNEPLLTDEEIEAFFAPVETGPEQELEPATEPAAAPGGVEPTNTESDGGAPLDLATVSPAPLVEEDETSVRAAAVADLRPRWLKDQSADLADLVQTLDLRARANHAHVGLQDELARLRQFTRTIGFVASPPPPGDQDFDLAVLVEEQLGGLAGSEPDAPRLLFRRAESGTAIQADKLLVTMALEALLQTAVGCAGPGDVVRVSVDAEDGGGPSVRIRFPAGPLRDLAPADVLQPYALKTRLPRIGANALAAAGAIAVGQGGDLVLEEETGDVRVFEVSFSDRLAS